MIIKSFLTASVIALSWVPSAGADPANHEALQNSIYFEVLISVPAVDALSFSESDLVRGRFGSVIFRDGSVVAVIPFELEDTIQGVAATVSPSAFECTVNDCFIGIGIIRFQGSGLIG